ncbi:hypothetical protein PAPYR_2993 [Paratrimastix pyriformis]|uniref:UBX domain-containing protein n=1 Tax=Paratrimastix pyriformis TaxID=342808 RepID=A0ABQ8URQ2_9EUKA|nr:hypothetical protein PAPYR_2993 [Paratrimastix pyriformis]
MVKKKKGHRAASSDAPPAPAFVYERPPELVDDVKWVTLHVRPQVWTFLNFDTTVPLSTRLYRIIDQIKQQHGNAITRLTLYLHDFTPKNVLANPLATLEELGVPGGKKGEVNEAIIYTFHAPHLPQDELMPEPNGVKATLGLPAAPEKPPEAAPATARTETTEGGEGEETDEEGEGGGEEDDTKGEP